MAVEVTVTGTKSDRAAAEFKAAARRVFARQGYRATKITDITAEAGRAAGGIYRYFASKSAVLKALADDFLDALHERVVHSAGDEHTMTTEAEVRDHVRAYWRTYREYLPEMVAVYEASMSDPEFAEIWQRIRGRDLAIWRAHVGELRAHLRKPVGDTANLAHIVLSLLEHYCYTSLHLGRASKDGVDALARFIYGGITVW
jgi:AcrR family transcriptional regulator